MPQTGEHSLRIISFIVLSISTLGMLLICVVVRKW
ncbi:MULTISPECIES: LPXTG cell wall anchor domain-containing protein [Bacteroides]